MKTDTLFDLIETAQDKLGVVMTGADVIIIRDALIEANKMRIALERIEKNHSESCSNQLARNALQLIEYDRTKNVTAICTYDLNRIKSILDEYDSLKTELERILDIMDSYSREITSVYITGDVFDVSYNDCCRGCDGYNNTTIHTSLIGKSQDEIIAYLSEQKRIKEENDKINQEVAKKQLDEDTRNKELAELARLNAKYGVKND